jgi:hypothetical protein
LENEALMSARYNWGHEGNHETNILCARHPAAGRYCSGANAAAAKSLSLEVAQPPIRKAEGTKAKGQRPGLFYILIRRPRTLPMKFSYGLPVLLSLWIAAAKRAGRKNRACRETKTRFAARRGKSD